MSRAYLITFKNGKVDKLIEYGNSWGGAARIWTSLFNQYITKKHECDSWLAGGGDDKRLWDLATDSRVSFLEKVVHVFTFDRHYVLQKDFVTLVRALRYFSETYATNGVDHLPRWADWIESHPEVEALSLHCTSVSENPWIQRKKCSHCDNEINEWEYIPLSGGCDVFEFIQV